MKVDISKFKELLEIERERNELMVALSETLGIDISFSEEEIQKNAIDAFTAHTKKELERGIEEWMKSAFSKN